MKSKWNGQACPICAAGVLHDGRKTVTQDYKGHPYQAKVRGAFCDKCDEGMLVYDAAEEAAWLAFRDQVDRQAASELVSIRKRLKLTQAQAAKLAGGEKMLFPAMSADRLSQWRRLSICSSCWTSTRI